MESFPLCRSFENFVNNKRLKELLSFSPRAVNPFMARGFATNLLNRAPSNIRIMVLT